MSRKRLGRLQRAATIIPLALLSAAWTASVAGIGGVSAPTAAADTPGQVTDGTSVPEESIDDPASLSDPASVDGLTDGNEAGIISASTTNAIPAAALAAYQRAETVINSADESCNITWQLIAAIGRVESDHGRVGGNVLNDDGVATPGIYGPALDGKKGTKAISDTDAGVYDKDTQWDRAVGPMQFIPSTWQVVGVDADDDAARNPQDIDDAALAAAVYLCSGDGDLSTVVGQRAAVYRYNHSQAYVDLVLKIMNAYLEGDFTSVPNNSTAAGYIVPEPPSFNTHGTKGNHGGKGGKGGSTGGGTTGGGTGGTTDPGTGGTPGNGGTPGTPGGGTGGTGGTPGLPKPGGGVTIPKTNTPLDPVVEGVDSGVGAVTSNLISGVLGLLAKDEAKDACQKAYPKLTQSVQLLTCMISYGLKTP
ncbi:lytic murein transglycosylase [Nocardioides ginsengisoli]|uniref:Lytic murein transglycosylase n=1 Tax=Nocardioides ginsengisoli TaxID=363868 RepID=A0ABW3VYV0_9ACTN